jgi:hypothetical protein
MANKKTNSNGPEQSAPAITPVPSTRTVEELAVENAEKDSIIEELQARLNEEAGKKTSTAACVEHEGRSYEVTAPRFSFNGEILTAETLQEKPEVVAELVKIGSGVLKEIV